MPTLTLDHSIADVKLHEDGILEFHYKKGAVIEREDAVDLIEKTTAALEGKGNFPTLVLVGDARKVTRGAREFYARDPMNAAVSSRVALVGTSSVGRVIANFFLGLNRPDTIPVRVFADIEGARAWLFEES